MAPLGDYLKEQDRKKLQNPEAGGGGGGKNKLSPKESVSIHGQVFDFGASIRSGSEVYVVKKIKANEAGDKVEMDVEDKKETKFKLDLKNIEIKGKNVIATWKIRGQKEPIKMTWEAPVKPAPAKTLEPVQKTTTKSEKELFTLTSVIGKPLSIKMGGEFYVEGKKYKITGYDEKTDTISTTPRLPYSGNFTTARFKKDFDDNKIKLPIAKENEAALYKFTKEESEKKNAGGVKTPEPIKTPIAPVNPENTEEKEKIEKKTQIFKLLNQLPDQNRGKLDELEKYYDNELSSKKYPEALKVNAKKMLGVIASIRKLEKDIARIEDKQIAPDLAEFKKRTNGAREEILEREKVIAKQEEKIRKIKEKIAEIDKQISAGGSTPVVEKKELPLIPEEERNFSEIDPTDVNLDSIKRLIELNKTVDPDFFKIVINMYKNQTPFLIGDLREGYSKNNEGKIKSTLEKMEGSSENLGLIGIVKLIEKIRKTNDPSLVEEIQKKFDQSMIILQKFVEKSESSTVKDETDNIAIVTAPIETTVEPKEEIEKEFSDMNLDEKKAYIEEKRREAKRKVDAEWQREIISSEQHYFRKKEIDTEYDNLLIALESGDDVPVPAVETKLSSTTSTSQEVTPIRENTEALLQRVGEKTEKIVEENKEETEILRKKSADDILAKKKELENKMPESKKDVEPLTQDQIKTEISKIVKENFSEKLEKEGLKFKGIDIKDTDLGLRIVAKFKGGLLQGSPDFIAYIRSIGGKLVVIDKKLDANPLVTLLVKQDDIDNLANSLGEKVKEYIEKDRGKNIERIDIENGNLKITYS